MRLHLPSLRAAMVLLVDAAARIATTFLERADRRVCRAANDLTPED